MKQFTVFILISLLPAFVNAALLRYELEFTPWSWPPEIGVYPSGTGHLIANTKFDAVVGGELKSDHFHFFWTNSTLSPIQLLGTYYDGHVVRAGGGNGIDAVSGVAGNLDLIFYLPPNLDNYSGALDQHINEDIWSELIFPNDGPPADQWEYYNLRLMISISPPTVLSNTKVAEPPASILLALGLAAFGAIRLGRRDTAEHTM